MLLLRRLNTWCERKTASAFCYLPHWHGAVRGNFQMSDGHALPVGPVLNGASSAHVCVWQVSRVVSALC